MVKKRAVNTRAVNVCAQTIGEALEVRPVVEPGVERAVTRLGLRYLPGMNPRGGTLPGVPLRDLAPEEVAGLPGWLRAAVLASRCWERVESDE